MEQAKAEAFNEEVERYRQALLYHAKKCDWETFKAKAGRLFDYLEFIEMSETQRRFSSITKIIVAALVAVLLIIWGMHTVMIPEQDGIRRLAVLTGLSISSFEFFFLLNFERYKRIKKTFYGKRRQQFISLIEQDFRTMGVQDSCS